MTTTRSVRVVIITKIRIEEVETAIVRYNVWLIQYQQNYYAALYEETENKLEGNEISCVGSVPGRGFENPNSIHVLSYVYEMVSRER